MTELKILQKSLGVAMRNIGLGNHASFTPHITMLYDQQSVPETSIDDEITWTVREFVLVHSLYGQSQHLHRARWQLR